MTTIDEPLVALIRTLAAHHQDDERLAAHIEQLADDVAVKLQSLSDETLGDRFWFEDGIKTLTRLIAHLGTQQAHDRDRIDTIEHALTVQRSGATLHLVDFQTFAHDVHNSMQELHGQTFNPIMDRIIAMQERLDMSEAIIKTLQSALPQSAPTSEEQL
jgi:hypothetical protein